MSEQIGPAPGMGVPVRDHRDRQGPRYREVRVVVHDTEVFSGVVRPVDPVADVGGQRDGLEAVQKAGRHVQMSEVVVIEEKGLLSSKRRRPGSNVDQHVVHGAVGASHQLRLAPPRSTVHSAHHSTHRPGLGVLHKGSGTACPAEGLVEQFGIEGTREQTPVISERLRAEKQDIREVGRLDAHRVMLP